MKRALTRLALPVVCAVGRALFALGRALRRGRGPAQGPRKVLVVKLWAIGEVVMATPVLEALKRHDPRCEVHMLVGSTSRAVVERNPFCDRILSLDESVLLGPRPWEALRFVRRLRMERYDAAVVLHHFFLFGLLTWLAGIPVRTGIDRRGEGFALTVRVPRPSRPTHRVVEYLSTVAALGVDTNGLRPLVKAGPEGTARAALLLREIGVPSGGRRTVGVLPTGGANAAASEVRSNIVNKRWPAEYYVDLTARLARKGCDVLVLGGPGETHLRPRFERIAGPRVRVLLGRTSLATTMGLMKRCDVIVTNDSGPMHIADALGVRLVAVFGPTDPRIVGPYGQPASFLRAREDCSPCFDEDVFPNRMADCGHQRCMRNVPVEMVLDAVKDALEGADVERFGRMRRPAGAGPLLKGAP